MIADATELNPSLKPSDTAKGKGTHAIPGILIWQTFTWAAHECTRSQKVKVTDSSRIKLGHCIIWIQEIKNWLVDSKQLKSLERVYLVAARIENSINFIIFLHEPLYVFTFTWVRVCWVRCYIQWNLRVPLPIQYGSIYLCDNGLECNKMC